MIMLKVLTTPKSLSHDGMESVPGKSFSRILVALGHRCWQGEGGLPEEEGIVLSLEVVRQLLAARQAEEELLAGFAFYYAP